MTKTVDCLVIGGGFYGCALALFLRTVAPKICLVEAGDVILGRASRVNQARVHTGFHYPRSALTAVKSMALHKRFKRDFPEAVHDEFQMLYAIARSQSKVSARRFLRMFEDMGAPIEKATASQSALFDDTRIEGVFACDECAFDYSALRRTLTGRLDSTDIDLRTSTAVVRLQEADDGVVVGLSDGTEIVAKRVFNITYAQTNKILDMAGLPRAALKHELTEVALITPPQELSMTGVTVMDGQFFSAMPYPSTPYHSLTHVRYTPHKSWIDPKEKTDPYGALARGSPSPRARYMINDARRFLPCIADAKWKESLFEVKTVLVRSEGDDGRPILYQRRPVKSRITSILGGKIDNIYDLFELVRSEEPELRRATDALLLPPPSGSGA